MKKQDVVRLGLSGCGSFSGTIANAVKCSTKTELVTCFDLLAGTRRNFSKKFDCDQEESYEALVKRDDLDGVLIITPNAVHAEQAVLAARNRKHIFVEKPIANTLADGRRIIEACKEAGITLMVGHYRRRNTGIRKIKEFLENGTLGQPVMVEANVSNHLGFELTPDKFRWRGDDSGCPAGALMTMGIHHVDVFNYLFGPIESVFSYFNKLYIPAEVEDVNATICQFESGALGYLGTNYTSPKANWMKIYGTEANVSWSISAPDVSFEEYLLAMSKQDTYTRVQLSIKGNKKQDVPLVQGDPFLEEINEFADCIRAGERPETDGNGALVALAYVRAAIVSAREGRPAKLEL